MKTTILLGLFLLAVAFAKHKYPTDEFDSDGCRVVYITSRAFVPTDFRCEAECCVRFVNVDRRYLNHTISFDDGSDSIGPLQFGESGTSTLVTVDRLDVTYSTDQFEQDVEDEVDDEVEGEEEVEVVEDEGEEEYKGKKGKKGKKKSKKSKKGKKSKKSKKGKKAKSFPTTGVISVFPVLPAQVSLSSSGFFSDHVVYVEEGQLVEIILENNRRSLFGGEYFIAGYRLKGEEATFVEGPFSFGDAILIDAGEEGTVWVLQANVVEPASKGKKGKKGKKSHNAESYLFIVVGQPTCGVEQSEDEANVTVSLSNGQASPMYVALGAGEFISFQNSGDHDHAVSSVNEIGNAFDELVEGDNIIEVAFDCDGLITYSVERLGKAKKSKKSKKAKKSKKGKKGKKSGSIAFICHGDDCNEFPDFEEIFGEEPEVDDDVEDVADGAAKAFETGLSEKSSALGAVFGVVAAVIGAALIVAAVAWRHHRNSQPERQVLLKKLVV